MATLTSNGAVNLTSSTNWSPAQTPQTGDDLVVGAHTLTLDADMTLNSITFSNTSSRMAIGGTTRSVQATNGFEITAAPSGVLISTTLTAGISVTLTGRWFGNGQTHNFGSGIANSTGGNLTLRTVGADPSAVLFANLSSGNAAARMITSSWVSGTLTTIGRFDWSNWNGSNTVVTITSGSWVHTHTGTSYFGNGASQRLLYQSGGTVSITGSMTTDCTSYTDCFLLTGGTSFSFAGKFTRTSSGIVAFSTVSSYPCPALLMNSGFTGTVTITGTIVAKSGSRACSIAIQSSGSRINWRSQSCSIAADESVIIYNGGQNVFDMTALVVNNAGRFIYTEQGLSTAVVDAQTMITNTTTSAQSCVVSASGALDAKVINLASDAPTLPLAQNVAAGTGNYGYSISPIIPTGLVVDPAVLASSMTTALENAEVLDKLDSIKSDTSKIRSRGYSRIERLYP